MIVPASGWILAAGHHCQPDGFRVSWCWRLLCAGLVSVDAGAFGRPLGVVGEPDQPDCIEMGLMGRLFRGQYVVIYKQRLGTA